MRTASGDDTSYVNSCVHRVHRRSMPPDRHSRANINACILPSGATSRRLHGFGRWSALSRFGLSSLGDTFLPVVIISSVPFSLCVEPCWQSPISSEIQQLLRDRQTAVRWSASLRALPRFRPHSLSQETCEPRAAMPRHRHVTACVRVCRVALDSPGNRRRSSIDRDNSLGPETPRAERAKFAYGGEALDLSCRCSPKAT